MNENAERYWLSAGGPLGPVSEGGADVIVVDDPQMHGLIPLAKAVAADRPVIFRSHIEIRSDLATKDGSPQSDAWNYMWTNVQKADIFISHPVKKFVPKNVPVPMIGYLPAATDWYVSLTTRSKSPERKGLTCSRLDGLNKDLSDWDKSYYRHIFNTQCHESRM